jgi:ribonuclease P protein subunit RPR2
VQLVQLQTAYQASLTALANAIDSRDLYSHGHVERVTSYVFTIAKHLGWSDQTIEQLRYGAILHDIGKIHISESILLKPTSLSEAEWKEIHKHPVTGAEMVKGVPFLAKAEAIVRHHHERWDGTGYPDGLAEESIPEGARLVSVADSFDVMTHLRPYGRRLSLEEAFDEILSLAGKKYDPQVIAAFRRAWEGGQIHVIAGET